MSEPIAVIGLDAKLPCDGDTPEQFFDFLVAGRSARTPVPSDRFNAESWWHPDRQRDGFIGQKHGHFMKGNVKAFDAPFFAMTPAEAAMLDPQQRMLLECAYTALENSGYTMQDVTGSQTGVYAGAFLWDFGHMQWKDVDLPMTYLATGSIPSTLAGRVSWFYNLRGPAFSVDTACSSSMAALHQAVSGLKSRDCDMALACGTNVILTPETSLELNGLGVLDPIGASLSFDDRADGYGRGEGIGVVVLKRMSDALRDGDTIRAVIRNTGANHDGHSNGLTAPSGEAQTELMEKTYAQAKLNPAETRFFEAHGTGTKTGDPIEAAAISGMFSRHRSPQEPLYIGTLKSNIGHTEGNSGIASFIKAVLSVERGIIPANAWFQKLNAKIPDTCNFHFPTKALLWPQSNSGVRRVSVNSFGISGTNVHVIVEDALHFLKEHGYVAPHRTIENPRLEDIGSNDVLPVINGTDFAPQLFVLSSHDEDGINRLSKAYAQYLPTMTEPLFNLSHTLANKRSKMDWRAAVVATSGQSLRQMLSQGLQANRIPTQTSLAFVFTGQGAQWARMGLGLMHYPAFQQSLKSADAYLKKLGSDWSVLDEMSHDAQHSSINQPDLSQPLCTALQVALVDLLTDWGVTCRAVAGHSSGEIAAAYCVGAISRECAWRIAYWRGKLCAGLANSGTQPKTTMAAVGLELDQTLEYIDQVHKSGFQDVEKLSVACMNSKTSHTVSGDAIQIEALIDKLSEEKIFARKLAVTMAYHSTYMQPMSKQYIEMIGTIRPGAWTSGPEPLYFSSTYGALIEHSKLRDAAYWTKNLTSPVRFYEAMSSMLKFQPDSKSASTAAFPITDVLEIGPHSALQGPLRNIIDEIKSQDSVRYHHVLKRGEQDVQVIMQSAGTMFTRGIDITLGKVNRVDGVEPRMMIDLPRYPFNHSQEYWAESRLSRNFRQRPHARHELLGAPVTDWDAKHDAVWRNWIRVSENPWIEHHTVSGAVLYPAAGMLVMAIEACRQLAEHSDPGQTIKGFRFREVSFLAALQVPDDRKGIESHLYLRPSKQAARETKASSWRDFQICTAQDNDEWREHCRGSILAEYDDAPAEVDGGLEDRALQSQCEVNINDAQQRCKSEVSASQIYEAWEQVGLVFGPTFQTIASSAVDFESGKTFAKVNSTTHMVKELMAEGYLQPHLIHPTALDGALQVCLTPIISNPARSQKNAVVVSFLDEVWISGSEHTDDGYLAYADTAPRGRNSYEMSCTAVDPSTKKPLIQVSGCVVTEVDGDDALSKTNVDPRHKAWNYTWKPDPEFLISKKAANFLGEQKTLQGYLDILAHKNPAMNILEINNGAYSVTKDVLSILRQRYDHFDFTNTGSGLAEARDLFPESSVQFKELILDVDLASQGFQLASYDLVLAAADRIPIDNIDVSLNNISRLLKDGGRIILTQPKSAVGSADWIVSLQKSGFILPDVVFDDHDCAIIVARTPSPLRNDNLQPSTGAFYIIADTTSTAQVKIADGLSSIVATSGTKAQCINIEQYAQLASEAKPEEHSRSTCVVLLEMETAILTSLDEGVFAALKGMMKGKRLIWINRDDSPETHLVSGLAASIRREQPDFDFITLTLQSLESLGSLASDIFTIASRSPLNEGSSETSYKVIDGLIMIPRLVENQALTGHITGASNAELCEAAFGADQNRSLSLQIQQLGLLDSLCLADNPQWAEPLGHGELEIRTMATAINFKDLAVILGKINETPVGLEAAGVVTRIGPGVTRFKTGDRVFGFTFRGSFATHARGFEGTIAHVPEGMSFEEAAGLPITYTTAYACLYDIGELGKRASRGKKSTVLIHAAAGGVGQAAIQLAQREGAEIFATVGSIEKREFLQTMYGLPSDHIFSSRDVSFKSGVLRMTGGRGVDIVINSLAGDMLRATWELVAPFGRFAEIGLSDIEGGSRISMSTFARGARFESLELSYMRRTEADRLDDLFERTMDIVLKEDFKRTTPMKTYPIGHLKNAMRFMQSGKHIGKLVVNYPPESLVEVRRPLRPASSFDANATYVVAGGFGGLGLAIISWMVNRGAKHLIIPSRRGLAGDSAKALVATWQEMGVKIAAPSCDITNKEAVEKAITSSLSEMPPVRGCIQSSAVTTDNIFSKMTLDEWRSAADVKVSGSQILWDVLNSRSNSSSPLDFFIMLTSIFGVCGNAGSSNYGAGNTFQDAMARQLSSEGYNVVSMSLPLMSDTGMVATRPKLQEYLVSVGWAAMSNEELISALDYYCQPTVLKAGMSPEQAHVVPKLWLPKYSAAEGAVQPTWQAEPQFNHMSLDGMYDQSALSSGQSSGKRSIAKLLAAVTTREEAEELVLDALLQQLGKILNYKPADLDPARSMHAYGVDSLVAVELRVWMTKEVGSDISVFDLTGDQPMAIVAAKAAAASKFLPKV